MGQVQVVSPHRQYTALVHWATASLHGRVHGSFVIVDGTLPELEDEVAVLVRGGKRVLVYGGVLHSSRVLRLMRLGLRGYVPDTATLKVLLGAIRCIANDGMHLPFDPASGGEPITLTAAETAVADAYFLEAQEQPRIEVAKRLGIADSTLRNHLSSIRRKLGVGPRASRAAVGRRYRAIVQ
ncbi:hypothetical protein ACFRJ9_09265 [Paenarthrobacter sp. NPDC056912]|uniref:helix-turn-helix transcriptional regulator n=1 Tax=Paenarthrobacter sp. NPDC056912 TaxID=3345965 RepID=UPI00366E65F2